jgi:hypothetical protein
MKNAEVLAIKLVLVSIEILMSIEVLKYLCFHSVKLLMLQVEILIHFVRKHETEQTYTDF